MPATPPNPGRQRHPRVLGLVPARGGSRGIPFKNIVALAGIPLIAHTLRAAHASGVLDRIVVSTDSPKIAEVAREHGADVPFLRPAELSTDRTPTIDAALHAVTTLADQGDEFDVLVLLQPTQPLRTADDIAGALALHAAQGEAVASVCPVGDHPLLIRTLANDGRLGLFMDGDSSIPRQEMPPLWRVNGCVYVNAITELSPQTRLNHNPLGYAMPRERSIDIDDLFDLQLAEELLRQRTEGQ